jgi:beta-xylosidase
MNWRHGAAIVGNAIRAVTDRTFPLANATHYTLQDDDVEGFGLLDSEDARRPAWFAYRDALRK